MKKPSVVLLVLALLAACSDVVAPEREQNPIALEPTAVPQTLLRLTPTTVDVSDGRLLSGALYRVWLPSPWNGGLLIYAPGYGDPTSGDPQIRDDELGGTSLSQLFTQLGYAFITTSYHKGGLPLPQAAEDLRALAQDVFPALVGGSPRQVYIGGASTGGLVTAYAAELYPGAFTGALAACGPIGDFQQQMNYIGDFRVLFDHFFGRQIPSWQSWRQNLPGDPGYVQPSLIQDWTTLAPQIEAAVARDPIRAAQVLKLTGAAFDPLHPSSIRQTFRGVLWYHVHGTNDVINTLGGQPFDNRTRVYGSWLHFALNRDVARLRATGDARATLAANYETSGRLQIPMVSLHTLLDEITPHWHIGRYRAKLDDRGRRLHTHLPVPRYGHCNFRKEELIGAFALLVLKSTGVDLLVPNQLLPDLQAQRRLLEMTRGHGGSPRIVAE
jgi:pimeloyl-ACP methyl ester carboxylesterase